MMTPTVVSCERGNPLATSFSSMENDITSVESSHPKHMSPERDAGVAVDPRDIAMYAKRKRSSYRLMRAS